MKIHSPVATATNATPRTTAMAAVCDLAAAGVLAAPYDGGGGIGVLPEGDVALTSVALLSPSGREVAVGMRTSVACGSVTGVSGTAIGTGRFSTAERNAAANSLAV